MKNKRCYLMNVLLVLTALSTPSHAFIDSPLDWAFAPKHMRGLVCPSLWYACCSDLATWRHGSPCDSPKVTMDPEYCYEQKVWACCQVEVLESLFITLGPC